MKNIILNYNGLFIFNRKSSKNPKIIIFLFLILIIIILKFLKKQNNNNYNFEYYNYEQEIITNKIKKLAGYELENNEPYFLNGIIRKIKPKKCIEIGTSSGGSAIIILNAIKDINYSFLVSIDLNTKLYNNQSLNTGYRVKKYFPNLINKWKLYTGEQPHKFLDKLKMKFDFLFLDTVHRVPGEIINLIEVLPFLNENAIIILHDINFHNLELTKIHNMKKFKKKKISILYPSNIYLFTTLFGDKVIIKNKNYGIENIGAIFLYKNQKKHFIDYFLLLLSPWQYMLENDKINELRNFIKKYYKEQIYLNIFNKAIEYNKIYFKN